MKSFLIDPFTKTISEIDYDGNWRTIAPLLGDNVQNFDVVNINAKLDSIFVDDEGLLKDYDEQAFFYVAHELGLAQGHKMLAGRGIVLGADNQGESVAPKITLDELRRRIVWAMPAEAKKEAEQIMENNGKFFALTEEQFDAWLAGRGQ